MKSSLASKPTTAKGRLEVCLDCEHYLPRTRRCEECGCFLDLKTKMRWAVCPLGKW